MAQLVRWNLIRPQQLVRVGTSLLTQPVHILLLNQYMRIYVPIYYNVHFTYVLHMYCIYRRLYIPLIITTASIPEERKMLSMFLPSFRNINLTKCRRLKRTLTHFPRNCRSVPRAFPHDTKVFLFIYFITCADFYCLSTTHTVTSNVYYMPYWCANVTKRKLLPLDMTRLRTNRN